jgi:L-aminopeptidase/D-esterase-like protein
MTQSVRSGKRNLITDVDGIRVGHADDTSVLSGVSVVLPDEAAVAGVNIAGGAPATRETDALDASALVGAVNGIVVAGGSVFGLEAASGVTSWLDRHKRGFAFGDQPHVCPIVPAACLFDLANGGNKQWGDTPPYRDWGIEACKRAGEDFALGNHGAGMGALSGIHKGGIGSASVVFDNITVGALVAVNSFGSTVIPGTGTFWAAPFEYDEEFGGSGKISVNIDDKMRDAAHSTKASRLKSSANAGQNTTLCIVATDAILTPAEARRVAIMASDGMARAIRPVHTPYDGDVVFVLSTGKKALEEPRPLALSILGTYAGDVTARAIARGVYEAETVAEWTDFSPAKDQKTLK